MLTPTLAGVEEQIDAFSDATWDAIAKDGQVRRSGAECKQCWVNLLRPSLCRDEEWTAEQEKELVRLVAAHKERDVRHPLTVFDYPGLSTVFIFMFGRQDGHFLVSPCPCEANVMPIVCALDWSVTLYEVQIVLNIVNRDSGPR